MILLSLELVSFRQYHLRIDVQTRFDHNMAGSLGVEISTWPGACDMGGGTDDGPEID